MVIQELQRLMAEAAKAPQAIFEAEKKLAEAEFAAERGFNLSFLNAEGTVADRTAIAKLENGQLRLDADIARAELNRVKTKAKHLSDAHFNCNTCMAGGSNARQRIHAVVFA